MFVVVVLVVLVVVVVVVVVVVALVVVLVIINFVDKIIKKVSPHYIMHASIFERSSLLPLFIFVLVRASSTPLPLLRICQRGTTSEPVVVVVVLLLSDDIYRGSS
jgi:hypothetical protein